MVEEQRGDRRARLFLTAHLRVGHAQRQVTVRNLSATGAMIELPQPPPAGTEVELSRGNLVVGGEIAWSRKGSCGLRFATPIPLENWVPSTGQQRVDEDLARLRAGTAECPEVPAATDAEDWFVRISEELDYVGRMLEGLGDELADDNLVTARHAAKLQSLDIAVQTLGHLARLLVAVDRHAATREIGMAELRRRLTRKSL